MEMDKVQVRLIDPLTCQVTNFPSKRLFPSPLFAADYPFINYYVIHRPHRESHEVHRRIRQRVFEAALADPEANSAASAAAAAAAAAALAAAAAAAAASSPTGSSKVRRLNSALGTIHK